MRDQITDPEQSLEFRNFARCCKSGMRLFDIGASYGVFSLTAAHFGGTAVAVDPSPVATRLIRVQIQLNKYENNVRIVQACASDTTGDVQMLSAGVFSDGYFRMTQGRPSRELTKTKAVTIDQLADQFGPPTHIKIDVEGHEAAVLCGGRATLARWTPLLLLELHNEMIRAEGEEPSLVLDDLAENGYELFSTGGTPIGRSAVLAVPISRFVARYSR